jgi:hypothetical protein
MYYQKNIKRLPRNFSPILISFKKLINNSGAKHKEKS